MKELFIQSNESKICVDRVEIMPPMRGSATSSYVLSFPIMLSIYTRADGSDQL